MDKKTLILLAGVGGVAALFLLKPKDAAASSDAGAYQMLTNPWGFGLMSPYAPINYNVGWPSPPPVPDVYAYDNTILPPGYVPPGTFPTDPKPLKPYPYIGPPVPAAMVPTEISLSVPDKTAPAIVTAPVIRGGFYVNY